MSRYIERKAVIEHIGEIPAYFNSSDINYGIELAIQTIKDEPIAEDVVKVVRCKDCKYFVDKQSENHQGICMCGEKDTSYAADFYPYADDFCSYGERKDKE